MFVAYQVLDPRQRPISISISAWASEFCTAQVYRVVTWVTRQLRTWFLCHRSTDPPHTRSCEEPQLDLPSLTKPEFNKCNTWEPEVLLRFFIRVTVLRVSLLRDLHNVVRVKRSEHMQRVFPDLLLEDNNWGVKRKKSTFTLTDWC